MSLRNFSPLHCLSFDALTPTGERACVVIVKATLDLVPEASPQGPGGCTHRLKLSQKQVPLAFEDAFHGDPHVTSPRREGEGAPAKPHCDIILVGQAHAPAGVPVPRFRVALSVLEESGTIIVRKELQMTGGRFLVPLRWVNRVRGRILRWATLGRVRPCPWALTEPEPMACLPLRYEFAFGGWVRAKASDPWARAIPDGIGLPAVKKVLLRRACMDEGMDALLAEAWWKPNPVGCGFAPLWYLHARDLRRIPAPQVEDPAHPFQAEAAWKAMTEETDESSEPSLRIQGFGGMGRTWASRLSLAGSWDEAWAASGKPFPPDYDEAFENSAHPELQCRHLKGDETVELMNLLPAPPVEQPETQPKDRVARFRLPGLRPLLHRMNDRGGWDRLEPALDTVLLEPDSFQVTILHRCRFPSGGAETLELRLAMPSGPRKGERPSAEEVPDGIEA